MIKIEDYNFDVMWHHENKFLTIEVIVMWHYENKFLTIEVIYLKPMKPIFSDSDVESVTLKKTKSRVLAVKSKQCLKWRSRIIWFFKPIILKLLGKILPKEGSSHLRAWDPKIESIQLVNTKKHSGFLTEEKYF